VFYYLVLSSVALAYGGMTTLVKFMDFDNTYPTFCIGSLLQNK